MGFFNKIDNEGNFAPFTMHYAGLPNYEYKDGVCITVDEKNKSLIFKDTMPFKKNRYPEINLAFNKIIGAEFITQDELKDASVIGRAVVGGILFGGIGAIVGGISGQGQKVTTKRYFAISYIGNTDDPKTILLDDNFQGSNRLKKRLNEIATENKPPVAEDKGPIEL